MSKFSNIRKGLSNLEALEWELHLKQLQINRLLNITQAINNNLSAKELFAMYNSFLSWEMGVKKMALFVRTDGQWNCASYIGVAESLTKIAIDKELSNYDRLRNLDDSDHPLIREFDVVVPVLHKEEAIAYCFIGGFDENDDMYNKVQFIITITNVIAVAIENKRLFKKQIEQTRLEREMELAGEMQKMLIPLELPCCGAYELDSIYKPHLGIGGDYFDAIQFEDGHLAFCVADISGKGLAAALLMANFQANFHSLINRRTNLTDFIIALNTSVLRITHGEKFITFFVAEYDPQTRTLRYINAGHNPPVLVINQKQFLLDKGCTILGSFKDLPEIEAGEVQIKEEAMILAFTDGLTDLKNNAGEFLNEQMLYSFVLDNYQLSVKEFNKKLMKRIEVFKEQQNYPDDFTVLTCKIF
ncbi:MAG TPA: serine/threonine protein phosphatase [Saprospiraceae bacterium]|nr:serine/threonine protein phosphatase [Saprospiraceae bacterium]